MKPSRRTFLGGTFGATALALTGGYLSPRAMAAPPNIIGCDTWGAAPPKKAISMVGPPTTIVIHHTESANVTDYSLEAAYDIARQIQSWHFARPWADTGQHFTVSRGGYVLEGRHRTLEGMATGRTFPEGAHASGQNTTALGIETQGSYMDSLPRAEQWTALVQLCAHLCRTYGLKASCIEGHRHFNSTDCPGDTFFAALPRLRSEVAAALGDDSSGGGGERAWPKVKSGSSGVVVEAAQRLLTAAGQSVNASGTFDAATLTAVKAFQSARGLTADGVIGRLTWEAPLAIKVRNADRGEAVTAVQVLLIDNGRSLTADGVFGAKTLAAVKAEQSQASLAADGVVGPDTWAHLLGG